MDLIEKWILEGITLRGMRKHDDIALIDRVFFFFFSLISNDCLPFHKMIQRFAVKFLRHEERSALLQKLRRELGGDKWNASLYWLFLQINQSWYVPRNRTIEINLINVQKGIQNTRVTIE